MFLKQLDGKGNILGTVDLAARVYAQLEVTNIDCAQSEHDREHVTNDRTAGAVRC